MAMVCSTRFILLSQVSQVLHGDERLSMQLGEDRRQALHHRLQFGLVEMLEELPKACLIQ